MRKYIKLPTGFKLEKSLFGCSVYDVSVYKYSHKDGRIIVSVEYKGKGIEGGNFIELKNYDEYSKWHENIHHTNVFGENEWLQHSDFNLIIRADQEITGGNMIEC